ncbi:M13-type metalloendopeptidase [Nevskia sp.]|uniref:M13 family metallopeptidase n=1 Tax=Nevskia sp. TaxID=1929292 RepID=UPI0025FDA22E|nr:M13-type metalloendopeptidase [Nevskia sp.]
MKRTLLIAVSAALVYGCGKSAEAPKTDAAPAAAATPAAPVALTSGIDTAGIDAATRPQDDTYRHLNGKWLDSFEIPADKARYGSFTKLSDDSEAQLRAIIEAAAADENAKPGTEAQQIGDLFKSFMDEAKAEEVGMKALEESLKSISALPDKKGIPAIMSTLAIIGVGSPVVPFIHQDNKDSTKYIVDLYQYGLGLPDRDYYLKDTDKYKQSRSQYLAHIEKILTLAGDADAAKKAKAIFAFETDLAKVQWDKVENRNPVKTYNKVTLADLPKLAPGFDFKSYFEAGGMDGKFDYVIVSQPTYITAMAKLIGKAPLDTLKAYFKWHLLNEFAPYLNKAFVDENFAFYGTALRGIPEQRPRWKRGVEVVETAIGEGVGKLYVEKHFPAASKTRMEALVKNLLESYKTSIDTLDWMSPETKKEAQAKLAKFTPKIGYPNQWRDYSKLVIAPDDLIGNLARARAFEYDRNLNKLGAPIDRNEWGMTPQTVNAYYNPEQNEIVFPAAILQPPFFNAAADDAVNYGGIGAVIGHEISHGFDDQGSQYDGDGNLRQWFTESDLKNFKAKTEALVAQYAAYEPVKGYHVDGKLTLGENIADLSGLAIAYKAYRLSLGGKEAPVIDGLTGDQRFFLGWAQVWRGKDREAEAIRRLTVDPHSPPSVRGNATLVNQSGFYEAFGVKEGDKMYLAPEKRVSIW